ncbi:hypothetical protein [Streptomyces sp. NPDC059455]|uniref:hypothetical protein n=1 Tax=Streptomyces sp. NPDC059455 TaxID=3346837 RepID=UPI0036CFF671
MLHLQGWRDYATPTTAECRQLDGTLATGAPVAHLAQGSAAYGFRVMRLVISVIAAQVIRLSECWTSRSQSRA